MTNQLSLDISKNELIKLISRQYLTFIALMLLLLIISICGSFLILKVKKISTENLMGFFTNLYFITSYMFFIFAFGTLKIVATINRFNTLIEFKNNNIYFKNKTFVPEMIDHIELSDPTFLDYPCMNFYKTHDIAMVVLKDGYTASGFKKFFLCCFKKGTLKFDGLKVVRVGKQ